MREWAQASAALLHDACWAGHVGFVELLLGKGWDAEAQEEGGVR